MNPDNVSEYIPLLQALKEKALQEWKDVYNELTGKRTPGWVDITDTDFSRPASCYRRRPEPVVPREWTAWANIYTADDKCVHATLQDAELYKRGGLVETIRVTVREVLPQE